MTADGGTGDGRSAADALVNAAAAATLRRSIIRMSGADTFDFLHRMSTNDFSSFADGASRGTVFVNEKGRVLDLVTVLRSGDEAVIVGSGGAGRMVASWLGKFIIMDDVRISVVSDDTPLPAVYGPSAGSVVGNASGPDPAASGEARGAWIGEEHLGSVPGYLIIPAGTGDRTTDAAPENGGAPPRLLGLPVLDPPALETARIEECVPVLGKELGQEVNALEAGLKRYISFSKGCYIGQEVIARLDTYRKLQSVLALFALPDFDGEDLQPGRLRRGETDAGRITSVARSPRHSAWIGLGYRRIRMNAGDLDFFPGGGGAPLRCSILKGCMPGYEEYETET